MVRPSRPTFLSSMPRKDQWSSRTSHQGAGVARLIGVPARGESRSAAPTPSSGLCRCCQSSTGMSTTAPWQSRRSRASHSRTLPDRRRQPRPLPDPDPRRRSIVSPNSIPPPRCLATTRTCCCSLDGQVFFIDLAGSLWIPPGRSGRPPATHQRAVLRGQCHQVGDRAPPRW